MPCPCSSMNAEQKEASTSSSMRSRATVDRPRAKERDGGPRGWVHCATYLRTVCTVWRGKIGTTGETPGSHVLEAAEDGQCDGRGGVGLADGVGEKKIKKRAAGPTQGRAEKKEDQDMGVIASGCRIAWHMGPFGGVSGTAQGCTVSHTPSVLAPGQLRHLKGTTTQVQFFCSVRESERGERRGARNNTPPGLSPT